VDPSAYYSTQSPITDPGECVGLFDAVPDDIAGLCRIVQGVSINFYGMSDHKLPGERLPEMDTRYVEKMLARIVELDNRPLTEPRPPEKCLVGCCRDAAVLFCALARHQGIPTRTRVGFATYLDDSGSDFNISHEIAEYWDVSDKRWRLVDPSLDDLTIQEKNIQFDTCDVPRDQFLVAGKAWQMCIAAADQPNRGAKKSTWLRAVPSSQGPVANPAGG
jgi:hypothetical protein